MICFKLSICFFTQKSQIFWCKDSLKHRIELPWVLFRIIFNRLINDIILTFSKILKFFFLLLAYLLKISLIKDSPNSSNIIVLPIALGFCLNFIIAEGDPNIRNNGLRERNLKFVTLWRDQCRYILKYFYGNWIVFQCWLYCHSLLCNQTCFINAIPKLPSFIP